MKHLRDNKIEQKKKITATPLEQLIDKEKDESSKSEVKKRTVGSKKKK